MLENVIKAAGLSVESCADAIGVSRELFATWANGHRPLPASYVALIGAVLGLKEEAVLTAAKGLVSYGQIQPSAIWFKFRGEEFNDAEREYVLIIRRLGHSINQLEAALQGSPNVGWQLLFDGVRKSIDFQAPPEEQGKSAAKRFRELSQFAHGGLGVTEFMRGRLRASGVLLVESPIPKSQIEGCSFYVGASGHQRPCVFANNHGTTWFRRNMILMHEIGHAIFDEASGAEVDILSEDGANGQEKIEEIRAEAFARNVLLPKDVLRNISARRGVNFKKLSANDIAHLVSDAGIEQRTLLRIAAEHGFIDESESGFYRGLDISTPLLNCSEHALSKEQYLAKIGQQAAQEWTNKRTTVLTARKLMLPVPYINAVLSGIQSAAISISRACDHLMIDEDTFARRFPEIWKREMAA